MFAEQSTFLDKQLDDSLCNELEKRLEGRGPCQAFLSSLEATIEQCRKSPAEYPTAEKAIRLRNDLMKTYARVVATFRPQT
jgi:hypothetical protein